MRHHCKIIVSSFSCFWIIWFSLIALILATLIKAADKHTPLKKDMTFDCKFRNSYCGISCIYLVLKLAGKNTSLKNLIKPEYIGTRKGSSLAELEKAARDHGLYAKSVGKLTSQALKESPYPVILHVKSTPVQIGYGHYILFLRATNEKALLFDSLGSLRKLVSFHELAPRWDGTGLIVSTEPIDLGIVFAPARKQFLLYVGLGIAGILILHLAKQRWLLVRLVNSRSKLFGLSTIQAVGFGVLAILCGMIYHFANGEGFLANANATASIQEAHLGSFIPKVSKSEVKQLLSSDTVFIDARYTRDFEAGHLEGAINVPVDANDIERQKVMANIEKDAKVVVYCQSKGCPFAEKVTKKLKADGFSDIFIFKGGWNEWKGKDKNNN